jgi:hypothetical protein
MEFTKYTGITNAAVGTVVVKLNPFAAMVEE